MNTVSSPQLGTPTRVRVKFCGVTRTQDAEAAAAAGVDAVGMVFYERSPRAISVARARAIADALPPFVTKVGLFVDAAPASVREALEAVPLDLLQFHGDEPPEQCSCYGRPWIKAVRMRPGVDLRAVEQRYAGASALLLDTYRKGLPGGTGHTFDWSMAAGRLAKPVILAGGLTPDNVVQAVECVRPYAVDVSGGIETRKGIKDADLMNAFMRGISSVKL